MTRYIEKAIELLDLENDFKFFIDSVKLKTASMASLVHTSKIVLCGFSQPARQIVDSGLLGNRIVCIIDKLCSDTEYKNIPVKSFDSIGGGKSEYVYIILTSVFLGDYIYELRKNGFNNIITYHALTIVNPEYDVFKPRYDKKTTEASIKTITDNKSYYKQLLLNLYDEKSKDLLGRMICYLLSYDIEAVENVKSEGCVYFDPIINSIISNSGLKAVIVDGGGFKGDTLGEFLSLNNDFFAYYLYEPDASLLEDLKLHTSDSRIKINEEALYDENTILCFSPDNTGMGHVDDNGALKITGVKLDDSVKEKITYIKLDVEGAEEKAIIGAKRHISEEKPALAISVYHRADDIFKLTNLVKSYNPDYKFCFRCAYNSFFNDMIMFCV